MILGTVGIPTIALILLLMLPFLDLRRERRLLRRPVAIVAAILTVMSMGVLTYKGATARESLATEVLVAVPEWDKKQGGFNRQELAGARLFAETGCTQCHSYLNTGQSLAPPLEAIGQTRDAAYLKRYVSDPSQFGNNQMPQYGERMTDAEIARIAAFLAASKGGEEADE